MSSPKEQLARLRRFNASVARGDAEIAEESAELRGELEVLVSPQSVEQGVELESIVLRRQRPVLSILRNETALVFVDPADSDGLGDATHEERSRCSTDDPGRRTYRARRRPAGLGRHGLARRGRDPRDQPPRRK